MRRASIDLFQRFSSLSFAFKGRQRSGISLFARQHFKFLLLARRFLFRPSTRRVACNRFDPPDSRGGRFFLHDPERTYLTCRSYVRATAKFHGVTIESARRSPRFFRSPTFPRRGLAASSMPRSKNRTSICPGQHNFPSALYQGKRFCEAPSATNV